ncbi:histidinol-phosphatase [Andreesenia angusta]|uniref:Histidinol-phosphatase n=1 Tax=Andreesenia angusta TaxID=39480 RepID=A0A1S1V7J1_9FIRM|nr:histidinol-phosphatase HisJ family protein [Andreesenia angusta]OHW62474.1 histidinol-phosphatase [Andreesenia angusta]
MQDYHVHSSFSGDCAYTMEEMVLAAIAKNIEAISFTDHVDYDYGDPKYSDLFIFNTDDYLNEVNRLRSLYGDRIDLLSGVEMGMQPHLVPTVEDMFPFEKFDFTIMSIHTSKRKDLHEGAFFQDKSPFQAYIDYYEELLYCVEHFNNYDVIGHINLIDRYSKFLSDEVSFLKYSDLLAEIFKLLIARGKGIEVNTSGFRYGMGSFLPNLDILKLYKSLGGEILVFGSDSHHPDDIASEYNSVLSALKSLDYKYISVFKDGNFDFKKLQRI